MRRFAGMVQVAGASVGVNDKHVKACRHLIFKYDAQDIIRVRGEPGASQFAVGQSANYGFAIWIACCFIQKALIWAI